MFVDSWDFRNQTSVGEAVFWVFWCWFVGFLVVEGVVLALGVWGFELEAMTDSGQSFKQQLVTNNSKHNNPNGTRVNTHLMQHISKYQLKLTVGSP